MNGRPRERKSRSGLDTRRAGWYDFHEKRGGRPGKEDIMVKVSSLEEMPESIGGVSAEERETVIRKDFLDRKAHICTTDRVEYRRLMRKCRENPDRYRAVGYETNGGQAQTAYFECPAKLVSYRSGKERALSDEFRAASAERMRALAGSRWQGPSSERGKGGE